MTASTFLRDDATFAQPAVGDVSGLTATATSNSVQYGDTNKTLTLADLPFVQLGAALTAIRTWTLPLSTTIPQGSFFVFSDDGGINGANTLKFIIQGADVLVGVSVISNVLTLGHINATAIFMSRNGAWHVVATT